MNPLSFKRLGYIIGVIASVDSIAEKSKLIIPIGEKVIVNAFHFLNKLKASGYDEVGVSINVSAIQLLKPDFTSMFLELMSEMQVNPRNIGIEITESVFASDYENINSLVGKYGSPFYVFYEQEFVENYYNLQNHFRNIYDKLTIQQLNVCLPSILPPSC